MFSKSEKAAENHSYTPNVTILKSIQVCFLLIRRNFFDLVYVVIVTENFRSRIEITLELRAIFHKKVIFSALVPKIKNFEFEAAQVSFVRNDDVF